MIDVAVGVSVFVLGLFKNVVIADHIASYSDPMFSAAATGSELGVIETWTGTLAYGFQIYFDFSGYSDMAIGLGQIFGIR